MLFISLMILYVIVCLLLCLVILIQSDKGGGISGSFGGGMSGANALLGTQDTANILTKATTYLATAYGVLCIVLALLVGRMEAQGTSKSVMKARAERNESPSSILQGGGLKLEEDGGAATQQGTPGGTPGGLPIEQ